MCLLQCSMHGFAHFWTDSHRSVSGQCSRNDKNWYSSVIAGVQRISGSCAALNFQRFIGHRKCGQIFLTFAYRSMCEQCSSNVELHATNTRARTEFVGFFFTKFIIKQWILFALFGLGRCCPSQSNTISRLSMEPQWFMYYDVVVVLFEWHRFQF